MKTSELTLLIKQHFIDSGNGELVPESISHFNNYIVLEAIKLAYDAGREFGYDECCYDNENSED